MACATCHRGRVLLQTFVIGTDTTSKKNGTYVQRRSDLHRSSGGNHFNICRQSSLLGFSSQATLANSAGSTITTMSVNISPIPLSTSETPSLNRAHFPVGNSGLSGFIGRGSGGEGGSVVGLPGGGSGFGSTGLASP